MERKNTILLTVIAIATLLVAVVGATFAYFTAQFNVQNDTQKSVTVQPTTVASVTFDYGNEVTVPAPAYPGLKVVKQMHVTGDGKPTDKAASIKLSLTGDIGEQIAANKHVKVVLYKGTKANEVSATTVPVTETVGQTTKYYDNGVLTTGNASEVYTFTTESVKIQDEYEISGITGNTDDYYFLVVEYVNDTQKDQDAEKADNFSITITATAVDVNKPGA